MNSLSHERLSDSKFRDEQSLSRSRGISVPQPQQACWRRLPQVAAQSVWQTEGGEGYKSPRRKRR
jgi:hypothetical protein